MKYVNGKWVSINPALNFTENPKDHYSPEVWIVNETDDAFDLPPELSQESIEYVIKKDAPINVPIIGKDCTYLRDDVVEVWKGGQGVDTTGGDYISYLYTFTDISCNYVIQETIELDGDAYYAITRVRHHFDEDSEMTEYLNQLPVVDGEVIDNE